MQKTKFLVVGQGLAGTLLSYELFKKNIPHLVISSLTTPVASLVAAGMYNPLVFKRITKSWMIDALLPIMKDTYQDLEQMLRKKLIYDTPIVKLIKTDEKELWNKRVAEEKLENYFGGFHKANLIEGIKQEYEVVKINNSGYVKLTELILAYANFLKRSKQIVNSDFNTKDLEIKDDSVIWKNIEAEKIVFCDGASAIKNPLFPKNVFYLTKGDVLSCYIENLTENYILNKNIFILPKGANEYLIGSTYHHDDLTTTPKLMNENHLLEKAQKLITPKIKALYHRVGIRPTTKDRRPILGYHNKHSNVAFFNGLGTKGVMLGPYFANEMLSLLLDKKYQTLPEVSIKRFY